MISKGVVMLRFFMATAAFAALATADGFTFTIGSAVAAQEPMAKTAAFAFRTEGCADPAKSQISATAEGLVRGARRSVVLKVTAMQRPGVYVIYPTWGNEGRWVVVLKGACESDNAGAIVPIGPRGFIRDSSKFFARPATAAEVDASLKTLVEGESK
jgi:hypothetical protein